MRKIVFLLCLLLFSSITYAQESWSIWLYSATTGEIFRVGQDGALQASAILPVPATFLTYTIAPHIAVSPDGQRIAYSISGQTADEQALSIFQVYDVPNDRLAFSFEAPQNITADSLLFSKVAWNSTGNTVAYAYAYGLTEESQGWELRVFNAVDGRVISEQSSSSAYFASQSARIAPYLLPVLQYHGTAQIGFNLVPYQTYDFSAELDSYEWDIVTGRVVRTNRAPRLTGDSWQITGESISPLLDERINYDAAQAPYTNALHIYRPEIAARVPFFATTGYDLQSAQFVENGVKVVAEAHDLLALQPVYLLISRAGVSRSLPQINPIDGVIIGTPTGFAYVIDNATPFLINLDTRDDAFNQSALWQAPPDSRLIPVWASAFPQADYQAWAQLAPPIALEEAVVQVENSSIAAQAVATITPIGSTGGFIAVNSVAVTYTTSGDRLNMRDDPALSGTIIARVDPGTRVVITDGPVAQDGFTWWEIRLPTGQIGWVVERTEGIQTLIPAN